MCIRIRKMCLWITDSELNSVHASVQRGSKHFLHPLQLRPKVDHWSHTQRGREWEREGIGYMCTPFPGLKWEEFRSESCVWVTPNELLYRLSTITPRPEFLSHCPLTVLVGPRKPCLLAFAHSCQCQGTTLSALYIMWVCVWERENERRSKEK